MGQTFKGFLLQADRPHGAGGSPLLTGGANSYAGRETPGILGKRTLIERVAQRISFSRSDPSPQGGGGGIEFGARYWSPAFSEGLFFRVVSYRVRLTCAPAPC